MAIYGIIIVSLINLNILYYAKGFFKYRRSFIFFSGLILFLVSGLRYQVGTDYPHYVYSFDTYLSRDILVFLNQPSLSIVARISKFFGGNYALWFFFMSAITVVPVIWSIKKHSVLPMVSIILYVLLGCWHFSFNLVKQTAAASVILLGYDSLKKRDIYNWILICLIASTFHFSALMMIPVYFLVINPVSKKNTLLIVLIGLALFLYYDKLFDIIAYLKRGEYLVGINSATRNNSVNLIRIAVNFAPLFLFYALFKKKEYNAAEADINIMANMSLLNAALNFGSMRSIYINRICVYTNLFNVFFIPLIIKKGKTNNKWFLVLVIYFLYIIFWWYDLKKGSTTAVFHWIFER